MADLPELDEWVAGIYQLETSDPALGGPDGIDNLQAKQLGSRTRWLRNQVQKLIDGISSAGIAKRLEQARMLSFKGAATGSGQFDGSADVDITLVLADSGAAAGSYSKVTLNAKGIVTSGTNPTTLAGYGIVDAANLTSPAFLGTPTVPDAVEGNSSAQAANTKFVAAALVKKFDKAGGVVNGRIIVDAPTQTETLAGLIIQNSNAGGWSGISLSNPNGSGNLRYSNSTNTLYLRNHITDFAHLDVGDVLSNSYKVHTARSFMMPSSGQWTAISGQVALPAGGTWAYVVSEHTLGGVPQANKADVVAGGTVVGGAGAWGFAWRIF